MFRTAKSYFSARKKSVRKNIDFFKTYDCKPTVLLYNAFPMHFNLSSLSQGYNPAQNNLYKSRFLKIYNSTKQLIFL